MKLKQEGCITYSELYGYVMESMRNVKKHKDDRSSLQEAVKCFENLEDAIIFMELHELSLFRLRERAYKHGDQFL